jgi:hypothetical protein
MQVPITLQLFYFCLCIHCCRNVFREPFPSNDRGIHLDTQIDGRDLRWAQVP